MGIFVGPWWARELWTGQFLDALAEEAKDGIALIAALERQWFVARRAVAGRRRDSRARAAVDILAAAPLVSATTLGQALGMATKNATPLLESFVVLGIASEVTHHWKRRLYELKHRRRCARPLLRRGTRCPAAARAGRAGCRSVRVTATWARAPRRRWDPPPLPPLERRGYEFGELDRWFDLADQAIRRTQRVLDETVQVASVPRGGSSAPHP